MKRKPLLVALWLAALAASGCAHRAAVQPAERPTEFLRTITFYEHPLDVHLARPAHLQAGASLVLYATGDGGWRGKDVETYRRMVGWGYPVAGFSAPSYLKHLGFISGTTTPVRLAQDYQRLIEFAKAHLRLPPGTRTILVGVSRGAGLAVPVIDLATQVRQLRRDVLQHSLQTNCRHSWQKRKL